MIVTKHGNTLLRGKCPYCGCEFLYKNTEIKTIYDRTNGYESEVLYKYMKCPECEIAIKNSECVSNE